jgi:uncharacterized protein (DUF1810 family)
LEKPGTLKSMTLFHAVAPRGVFGDALDRFFDGKPDDATLEILRSLDGGKN